MELGILVSGGLGETILLDLLKKYPVTFVFTDKGSEGIIHLCAKKNIPFFAGNPRGGRAESFIADKKADVLLSINYLFLIEKDIIRLARMYAINFHGSLLPKYRGRTPHVWAIINNEKTTGITAHLIDEDCDTGDIVFQEKIDIGPGQTGADILTVFKQRYPAIVQRVLSCIESGKLSPVKQDDSLASYFGKRTSEDGQIDWNWQKERIYNWVRAQAHPYPGAFTWYEGNKISIHEIKFSEAGYRWDSPNGLIVYAAPQLIRVKVPNGIVEFTKFDLSEFVEIKAGNVFYAKQ